MKLLNIGFGNIVNADRIIGIRAGRIVYDGPSKQVDQAVLNAIYGDDAETEATA